MIISIKSSASGGSSRGLIHYLAHSKLDREKEGIERREFFSESENSLDVRGANRHLSIGKEKPKPEELLHIVIAPSKEETQSVGDDVKTRKDALKAVVRETVAKLKKEVKAKKLKWVAAAHFNTDNPHAHIAVQKEFLNENGKTEHLRINRQMLHYNEVSANGEKKLHKGALILAAENKIEEIAKTRQRELEKSRDSESKKIVENEKVQTGNFGQSSPDQKLPITNFNERRMLAEEMLIASEIRRRERNIENLIEHGDKKRFKITDEQTGKTRHVSLFDIERKIEIVSRRKARLAHPKNAEKRAESALVFSQEERAKHEPVIQQLEAIRRHVLGFENRHLSLAQEKHTRLHNQKLPIEKKYERLQSNMPLPLFKPDEIQHLQSKAFREQNLEKILHLESIRQSNAAELNRPSRRDEDVRELLAAKTLAKLKIDAAEKRLLSYPANKDFIKVKVGDYLLSHKGLENHEFQSAKKNGLWSKVKLKTSRTLFRSDEKTTDTGKLDYPALHKATRDALLDLETERREEIKQLKEFNQTLDKIFDAETNPNKTKLTPAFSAFELAETEDLVIVTEHENFYEKSLLLQESWLREKLAKKISQSNTPTKLSANDKFDNGKVSSTESVVTNNFHSETDNLAAPEKIISGFVLARAEARIILAQMNAAQAQEKLVKYNQHKMFIKHRITDAKTGTEREVSLRDVEPRKHYYLLDSILERALQTKQQKELGKTVMQAVQKKEKELTQNLNDANNRHLHLENQKSMLRERYSALPETPPIFTPKEIAALETRAARTINKSEADRLEKIIGDAEKNNNVGRIHNLLEETAKKLELIVPNLTKNLESKSTRQYDADQRRQTVNRNREIYKQSATSDSNNRTTHQQVKSEKEAVKEKGRIR